MSRRTNRRSGKHDKVSAGGLSPLSIAGCLLQLRADLGTTIATGVSAWANQVPGSTEVFAQATGGKQPTLVAGVINGKPVLRFVLASTQFLSAGDVLDWGTSDRTVVTVQKTVSTATTGMRTFQKRGTGAAGAFAGYAMVFNQGNAGSFGSSLVDDGLTDARSISTTNRSFNDGNAHSAMLTWNSTTDVLAAYKDGTFLENGTVVGIGAVGTLDNALRCTVGCAGDAASETQYFDGDIGEVLLYDHALDAAERATLSGYLRWYWGIAG